MAIYKPYPKYKNSNNPWMGEIPEHWEIKRVKWILQREKREIRPEDDVVTAFRDGQVTLRKNRRADGYTIAIQEHGYQGIRVGDLVIHGMDAFAGAIGVSDSDGKASPVYNACTLKGEGNIWYFCWIVRQMSKSGFIESLAKGIRERSTDFRFDIFSKQLLPAPPKEEQSVIARFLDYKLAKINRFIRKKKQLIKLLNEQKAAIINQAVTKGLDPNVKMKDSGIEWLGEIPEHWEKYKLKYLISKPIAGAWGTEPQNDDNDITCVRVADFSEYEIKTDNLTIRNIEAKTEQILKPGDLLLEKSGGGEKTPVGRVVLFNQSFKAVTSNFVSKFSPKIDLVSSEYLLYMFKLINSVRWNFRSLKQTTGIQNIDTYQYMDNWVFIPKIEEQKIIVNHIKSEFKILDETITKIEKEIALVEEYKTALIAEAVTGKIDVRGYEVPEISEEETYEEIEEIGMAAEDAAEYENESDL